MKLVNLEKSNSLLNAYVAQIRDKSVQKDRMRFRTNLKRIGEIFAYEISQTLDFSPKDVKTPLGTAVVETFDNKIVLGTILRAGLPLHEGLLAFFDEAESGFLAAFRKDDAGGKFHINTEYCSIPNLEGKTLVIADTMAATGSSMLLAYERFVADGGEPEKAHLVCPIVSAYAVETLKKALPAKVTLWTAAIDEELTSHSLVVPGLGDAGDLSYGDKI